MISRTGLPYPFKAFLNHFVIALILNPVGLFDLLSFKLLIYFENFNRNVLFGHIFIDPNHCLLLSIDLSLVMVSRVSNLLLGIIFFNCREHTAHIIYSPDNLKGLLLQLVCERLYKIRSPQGINGVGHPGFLCNNLLGPESNGRSLFGRYSQYLVQGIGVQGLCAAHNSSQRLKRRPDDIVVRLLGR